MTPPLLGLRGVTKRYGGVIANDGVSFALAAGEVVGILGENGAGKSTLMNVVSGLIEPDSGEVLIDGRSVAFASPREAAACGIGMVHQHFKLVPTLSVVENVVLGDPRLPRGRLRLAEPARRIRAISQEIGLPIEPFAIVGRLGIGARQRVEIVKALYRGSRLLVLDEPTAVLSRAESHGLYAMIEKLAQRGIAVILISHKLDDLYAVCRRVIVMRQGRVVDDAPLVARSRAELVRAMIGEDIAPLHRPLRSAAGAVLLGVDGLSVQRDDGVAAFGALSFRLHEGEILALAGIEGSGQRELVEALTGLRPRASGTIRCDGDDMEGDARALRRRGLRHVPENRHESGILAGRSLGENFLLSHFFRRPFNVAGWLRRGAAAAAVDALIERYDVRATGRDATITALSGGNQQKLVLARELAQDARILIAAQPTRGLDVRTIAFVQRELLARRAAGLGVLLVSSDLAEIWEIADRVMVLAAGRLRGPVALEATSVEEVGGWMAGQ